VSKAIVRDEFLIGLGTYEMSVSDSWVSSDSGVGVMLDSLMVEPSSSAVATTGMGV